MTFEQIADWTTDYEAGQRDAFAARQPSPPADCDYAGAYLEGYEAGTIQRARAARGTGR